jgi:hypothetical protein
MIVISIAYVYMRDTYGRSDTKVPVMTNDGGGKHSQSHTHGWTIPCDSQEHRYMPNSECQHNENATIETEGKSR